MVNAVLRKVAGKSASQIREVGGAAKPTSQNRDVGHPDRVTGGPDRRVPLYESTAAFAERLGHPLWMVERWVAEYGRDAALKICESDQKEPAAGGVLFESGGELPPMGGGAGAVA